MIRNRQVIRFTFAVKTIKWIFIPRNSIIHAINKVSFVTDEFLVLDHSVSVGVHSEEVSKREVVGVAVASEHCKGFGQGEPSVGVSVDKGKGAVPGVGKAGFHLELEPCWTYLASGPGELDSPSRSKTGQKGP